MQFKYPELLYALLLLIVPIIVHLFQLRRFQKISFTNVDFLKSVEIQTRRSSNIKKWFILLIRLFLFTMIILAFAQPYLSKKNSIRQDSETVIYLDNSFSMEAQGTKGTLLKRAVQDILESHYNDENLTVFTNNTLINRSDSKTLQNKLLKLNYSPNQLEINTAILRGKRLFSKSDSTFKNLILISDFQRTQKEFIIKRDSSINLNLVQLKPVNTKNVSIDSLFISRISTSNIELTAKLNGTPENISQLPISLYNEQTLIAKSTVHNNNSQSATFSIPNSSKINGKIIIDDTSLQFDNTLYFNINQSSKINILSINQKNDNFLKRIFTPNEFVFQSVSMNQLNFNDITKQNIIVLNELDSIPLSLSNSLQNFTEKGGYIIIIPSMEANIMSYNQCLSEIANIVFSDVMKTEKKITSINYSHPIFDEVFDKQITNFQYPEVAKYYNLDTSENSILNFEDTKPFLVQSNNVFVFAGSLSIENSNFMRSPLIVPTFYNMGKQSLKLPRLYHYIGVNNTIDVKTEMKQDEILKLNLKEIEIIPEQQTLSTKVNIITNDIPEKSGTYAVTKSDEIIEYISFNYNRSESKLNYQDFSLNPNLQISNSLSDLIVSVKSDNKIHALWKWFVIFALIFLIMEMLILTYFK